MTRGPAAGDDYLERFTHDLKSPLRAVNVVLQWLEEELGDATTPRLRDHLQQVRDRVARANTVVDRNVAWVAAQAAAGPREVVDVDELVRRLLAAREWPAGVTMVTADHLPAVVFEPADLTAILRELLGNAAQHLGRPTGRIVVGGDEDATAQRLWVEDDGQGVEADSREWVFLPFRLLGDRVPGSAGMGLTIARRLAERNGASLHLEAAAGGGCRAVLTVPRRPAPAQ